VRRLERQHLAGGVERRLQFGQRVPQRAVITSSSARGDDAA